MGGVFVSRKAVAKRHGTVDEEQLELLYSGKSEVKLDVPASLGRALREVGLGGALSEVNVMTTVEKASILVNTEVWEDIEFEVALDSGSVVHACAPADNPGYLVEDSAGSRRG